MKTVREYYSALDPTEGNLNLEVISMGLFNAYEAFDKWPFNGDLIEQVCAVIAERADCPFLGGPTAAQIMDAAMRRYLVKKGAVPPRGLRGAWTNLPPNQMLVPGAWISTITKLKTLPPETD